jgi:Rrf2 family protein
MLGIAAAGGATGYPVTAASLSDTQHIPLSFLQSILLDLRRAGLLVSHRGTDGGYVLARSPAEISVGEILRCVSGELSSIRGTPARLTTYDGAAYGLHEFWMSVHQAITDLVDDTTLTDLLTRQRRPVS